MVLHMSKNPIFYIIFAEKIFFLKNIYGFTLVKKRIIIFGPKMSKSKAITFKDLFNSLLLSKAAQCIGGVVKDNIILTLRVQLWFLNSLHPSSLSIHFANPALNAENVIFHCSEIKVLTKNAISDGCKLKMSPLLELLPQQFFAQPLSSSINVQIQQPKICFFPKMSFP